MRAAADTINGDPMQTLKATLGSFTLPPILISVTLDEPNTLISTNVGVESDRGVFPHPNLHLSILHVIHIQDRTLIDAASFRNSPDMNS